MSERKFLGIILMLLGIAMIISAFAAHAENIDFNKTPLGKPILTINKNNYYQESFDIIISGEKGVIFTIKKDGTIIRGPQFNSNDKASVEFLNTLSRVYPKWVDSKCAKR